jgi:hypothetical protein
MGDNFAGWIRSGAQPGFSPNVSMCAPICPSGTVTRPIGREESEASPNISEENGCPASSPASRRMPVPEFPQSIGAAGASSFIDLPWIRRLTGP